MHSEGILDEPQCGEVEMCLQLARQWYPYRDQRLTF
jgi:hypothetical protein